MSKFDEWKKQSKELTNKILDNILQKEGNVELLISQASIISHNTLLENTITYGYKAIDSIFSLAFNNLEIYIDNANQYLMEYKLNTNQKIGKVKHELESILSRAFEEYCAIRDLLSDWIKRYTKDSLKTDLEAYTKELDNHIALNLYKLGKKIGFPIITEIFEYLEEED